MSREFRGAWVASVGNIDWPSTNALGAAQQQAELLQILDTAARLRLNAVILQVRPACDALYASSLEPWSEYLTGVMGRPPTPYYDPLAFAVEQAHRRGLELHAWFNPFRARHLSARSPIAATHVSRKQPSLVRQYGKSLWLDPGLKEARDYSLSVVLDVVRRYDVDAIHFDDYFYPYQERDSLGREIPFPDEISWKRYGAGHATSREDWRRANINLFVRQVYGSVKRLKPWVKVGVSPFGIWRPGHPPQIRGYDAYNGLFADARLWLNQGWMDYLAPQLYWPIGETEHSFPALLAWWAGQNTAGRHLWPGLNTVRVGGAWKGEEILRQIEASRGQAGCGGHIHWSMTRGLMTRNGLDALLTAHAYRKLALTPASPWLGNDRLRKPLLKANAGAKSVALHWQPVGAGETRFWVLQTKSAQDWAVEVLGPTVRSRVLAGPPPTVISLSPLDRFGNLGPAATLKLESPTKK